LPARPVQAQREHRGVERALEDFTDGGVDCGAAGGYGIASLSWMFRMCARRRTAMPRALRILGFSLLSNRQNRQVTSESNQRAMPDAPGETGDFPMSETAVLYAARDGAMWITLNRPAAMNSITPAMVQGIEAALDQALSDPDVRAVVLTGTGRAFCAGADLKYVREQTQGDESATAAFLQTVLRLMNRLETFPKPVIAAINGLALAGGLELVLCCYLVIAARSKNRRCACQLRPAAGRGSSVRLRARWPDRAKYRCTGEFPPS
jgi:hypothetical protein